MSTQATARTPIMSRADKTEARVNLLRKGAPLGFEAGDQNLYRYVSNRPTEATDPSGLQPANPPAQQPEPAFGTAQLRRLLDLNAADTDRGGVYDLGLEAAQYRQRRERLTPAVASAVFLVWERFSMRGVQPPGVRPLFRLDEAADEVAGDILRVIDERTAQMSFADPRAGQLLMRVPIGINSAASEASFAIALDTMVREQARLLNSDVYPVRHQAQGRLLSLFRQQPLVVAAILRDFPTTSLEHARRIALIVDPAELRRFERANSNVFRKYAEAIFREYLRPLPEAVVNTILMAGPDPTMPNQTRLLNMIRGR